MDTELQTRTASRLRSRLRDGVIAALLVVSVVWPLVNVGPRGPTILAITYNHGVDAGDLLAVFPFALALVLIYSRRR
jgi:hypothetical protein